MIEGLYEAHLPVRNLARSIAFYEGLGLEFDHMAGDGLAFLWIVKNKSWLGLWQCEQASWTTIRRSGTLLSRSRLKI